MTDVNLLAYFMINAPKEPQEWFKPKMETRPPKKFWKDKDGCATYQRPITDGFIEPAENQDEFDEYKAEFKKQKQIQWPRAWADEMMKSIEA